MTSKKKENDLRKAALDGDLPTLSALIASGTNLEAGAPKVRIYRWQRHVILRAL